MDLDREKVLKLVIVALATLAALAVMSTLVQLIQTILPFLIVGAGIYAGYRWALSDAPAPTADEVEEQARGIFSRFRRTKQVVETSMKVGDALESARTPNERQSRRRRRANKPASSAAKAEPEQSQPQTKKHDDEAKPAKRAAKSEKEGAIEFKDHDVVINADDVVQPDISRLEEKEKETPEVTNNVLEQIEARRRRLESGD